MSYRVKIGNKRYVVGSIEQAIHFLLANEAEEYKLHGEGD